MSGAEALAVIGLVSSILSIFDAASKVYDAAHDAKGLTKDFQATAEQIPLILNTLTQARKSLSEGHVVEETAKRVKPVLIRCKVNAERVQEAFEKALPSKDASFVEKSKRAAEMVWRSSEIKKCMEIVVASLDLLTESQIFHDAEAIRKIEVGVDQLTSMDDERGSGHHGTERKDTAPLPCCLLPFERDPDFVDREELGQLEEKMSSGGAKDALSGLGGIGKTQLAIEYCYRARDRSPDMWALWIHPSNVNRFNESLYKLADDLKIRGRSDPKANILQLVCDWLRDTRNGKWVLVLDNVDDAGFLLEPPTVQSENQSGIRRPTTSLPRMKYWPSDRHGSIILTSRRKHMVQRLVHHRHILVVNPMPEQHALTLLTNKLGKSESPTMMVKLATALDHMPLAMTQAAAYIRLRAPMCPIEQYLIDLERSREAKSELLSIDDDLDEFRRDYEARNSILLTWQISFDYIRRKRRSAAELLSLMSFYDNQGIPQVLLHDEEIFWPIFGARKFQDPLDWNIAMVSVDWNNAVMRLWSASPDTILRANISTLCIAFISVSPDGIAYGMHRLVQFAVEQWLEKNNQYQSSAKRSLRNLDRALPSSTIETSKHSQVLYPHAKLAVKLSLDDRDARISWSNIVRKAAYFALDQWLLDEAVILARKAVNANIRLWGEDDWNTSDSRLVLGRALMGRGEYKNAEVILRQAEECCKKELKAEDHLLLRTTQALARALSLQGQHGQAEMLIQKGVEVAEKVPKKDHEMLCLQLRNDLSLVLQKQGQYAEAIKLCRQVLDAYEKTWGKEHPETATILSNLADSLALAELCEWREIEEIQRRVLRIREEKLAKDHPRIWDSAASLGSALREQGKYEEAEEMQRYALDGRRRTFGPEHPATLVSVTHVAHVLDWQGKHQEAEKMYQQALDWYARVYGYEDEKTLTVLNTLAHFPRDQGRYEEAEKMYRQAVDGRRTLLGEEHPDTLNSVANLAYTLWHLGQHPAALEMMRPCVGVSRRVLGPGHRRTVERINELTEWESRMMSLDQLELESSALQHRVHETASSPDPTT